MVEPLLERLACAQALRVVVVGGPGHADGARAVDDGDLLGGTARLRQQE
jgi:hypothetical protein